MIEIKFCLLFNGLWGGWRGVQGCWRNPLGGRNEGIPAC
jgi:hypothetical protein